MTGPVTPPPADPPPTPDGTPPAPSAPAPPARRRAGRGTGAVAVVVAVVAVATIVVLALASPGPAPSAPPAGSPATPNPLPTVPSAATEPVIDVPASVDASGGSDVTDALQAIVDAAPDGATIRLAPDGVYRTTGALELQQRHDLVLDGRGATIRLVEGDRSRRRNLWLVDSTGIEIRDLSLVGSNPAPGVLDEARQFEHSIWIDGGSGISIEGVTMENPWGDCVYLGDRDGRLDWVDGFVLRASACHGPGRNAVSIVAGRNVTIEANTFGDIGLHAVDIEPNQAAWIQGAERVAVTGNRVDGPIEDYFFAANGWGPVDDLTVEGNVLAGTPLRITVKPLPESGYVRRSVRVADNRSDTPYRGEGTAALSFASIIGLTVTGNVVPLEGAGTTLASVESSCQVSIADNRFPGGAAEWQGSFGPCPSPTAP